MVDPLFQFHRLNETGIQKAQYIAETFSIVLSDLKKWCPESREFSIVKTKLEEASFFAKKAVANQQENQLL